MKNAVLYLAGIHDDDKRLSRLRQFAADRGYKINEREYVDENTDDRQQFQRLLQEAHDEGIAAVIVHDLGQLGLTSGLQIEGMLKLFDAGVGIASFVEDIDSSVPEGKEYLLRRIKQMESKLTPLPQTSTPGRKNRPGRKAADFNDDKGVRMRLEEEKSYTEIGTAMDVSKSTAHNRITRAILKRLELSLLCDQ